MLHRQICRRKTFSIKQSMLDLRLQVDKSLYFDLCLIRLKILAAFEKRRIHVHAMWRADDVIIVLSHLHVSEHEKH